MARIVLIEDETIIAMNTQLLLEEIGHEVLSIVQDGESAIEVLMRARPDLVMVDVMLQGSMTGIQTARLINERIKGLPIIFVTAHTDLGTIERINEVDHCGHLFKPFTENDLMGAISRGLGGGA